MSVIADLPDIRPSLLLDFANSRRVHPLIQCTRASTATCYGPDGKLRIVESNVPRIDFDPETGKCLGLLLEEARTNILLQSEGFAGASWSKAAAITVTSDPDGWSTVVHDGSANSQSVTQSNRPNTSNYASSFFDFKAGSLSAANVTIGFNGTANNGRVAFNFDTGVSSIAGVAGAITNAMITHSMKWMGDFWRCFLTIDVTTAGIAPTTNTLLLYPGLSATSQTAGSIRVRRGQVEGAPQASSYIPTTTAAATRAADSVTLQLSSPVSAGAWVVAATPMGWSGADARIVSLTDGTTANCVSLHLSPNGNGSIASVVTAAGNFQYGPAEGAILPLRRLSRALTWGKASARVATNGVLGTAGGAITLPAPMNRIDIGNRLNTQFFSGYIERCALYAARITDSQLQRITA